MFYIDTQRTVTRRESSLVTTDRTSPEDRGSLLTVRGHSSAHLTTYSVGESGNSIPVNVRPKGSVQRELVTLLFESMLTHIVDSWEVIIPPEKPEDVEKAVSEVTVFSAKKKGKESRVEPGIVNHDYCTVIKFA